MYTAYNLVVVLRFVCRQGDERKKKSEEKIAIRICIILWQGKYLSIYYQVYRYHVPIILGA